MIKKIRGFLNEQRSHNSLVQTQLAELNWANVFHDSVRGYEHLRELSLNTGRWAGGYPFFYCLNRILHDVRPKNILEFGLGESSKFISTVIEHELRDTKCFILEHNPEWKSAFQARFKLSENATVLDCQMIEKISNEKVYNSYSIIENLKAKDYDFFVVDGPIGTPKFSRYDIVTIIKQFNKEKEFVILFDDTNRKGEQETLAEIFKVLKEKGVNYHSATFSGTKSTTIVTSSKFGFLTSI